MASATRKARRVGSPAMVFVSQGAIAEHSAGVSAQQLSCCADPKPANVRLRCKGGPAPSPGSVLWKLAGQAD
eukprot:10941923-Lingulodinium_polyedra.AAC.1